MATTQNVTTQDLLNLIHIKYEQATDTPALTDDDGIIRMALLNEGINFYETADDTRWRELLVINATAPVIAAGVVSYTLTQDDFRELGSRLRLLTTTGAYKYVDVITPEDFQQLMKGQTQTVDNSGSLCVCVTGNIATGYQLNLSWIPSTGDGTVGGVPYFDYYKWANRLLTVRDVPEMSNPYYLVDYVTAELFANDDINLYQKFKADADNKLENMQTDNEATPPYASSAIQDQSNSFAMG